jgi:hypothetical protein
VERGRASRVPQRTTSGNGELTGLESERLDGSLGPALEALAQIPGALETAPLPDIPRIAASPGR